MGEVLDETKPKAPTPSQLIKQALALRPGERVCRGRARIRDEQGNKVLGEHGKALTRPCKRLAIKGGTVCAVHGGSAAQVKRKAEKRLLATVEPALARLEELMLQTEHLPTALGAVETILKRAGDNAIGVPKKVEQTDLRPVINIGIAVGGITAKPEVTVGLLPIAAEVVEDDEGD